MNTTKFILLWYLFIYAVIIIVHLFNFSTGRLRESDKPLFVKVMLFLVCGFYSLSLLHQTMIHILKHDSEQDANNKWKTFIADPVWIKAYEASKKNGNLVKKIEVVFTRTTDFSPAL